MRQIISRISLTFALAMSPVNAAIQVFPVADATVTGDWRGDSNFGNDEQIVVKNPAAVNSTTRKPYLRFNLSELDGSFDGASLNFVVTNNNNGTAGVASSFEVAVYGLNDNVADQEWVESAITWNNAPGNDTNSAAGFVSSESTFLGHFDVTTSDLSGATVSMASTALSSFLSADSDDLVTFMLARTDTASGNLSFSSREGTAAPYLTLVPEPSAYAAVVGLLALGFVVGRRRDS